MNGGGALDQVGRLLRLVPYLHSRGEVGLEEAAQTLGATPDQVLRDLKVLLMCGTPGGYPDDLIDVDLDAIEEPEGDGVIRVSNADYLQRPLRLTVTEATALIVALRAVRTTGGPDTVAVVDRTLAKLEVAAAAGGVEVARQVELGDETGDDARLRSRLEGAVTEQRQVRLVYYVPTRDEESERVVDPQAVVTSGGFDYLDAWCHRAEAPRLFRLDRIHHADVLETPARVRPDAAPERPTTLFDPGDDALRVRLRLAPPAFWVTEYYPVERSEPGPDGTLEVDLLVADPRWIQRLLLRLTPHADVLEPAAIREEYRARARGVLDLYR